MTATFIFRPASDPRRYALSQDGNLKVQFQRKYRTKRVVAGIREMEVAAVKRSKIEIFDSEARDERGRKAYEPRAGFELSESKRNIRRVRPQEQEQIDVIDEEIEEIRDLLFDAQTRRKEAVKVAWAKAHAVTQVELRQRAEEREAERERLREAAG